MHNWYIRTRPCPRYNSSAAQGQHLLTTLYATSILFIIHLLLSPFFPFSKKKLQILTRKWIRKKIRLNPTNMYLLDLVSALWWHSTFSSTWIGYTNRNIIWKATLWANFWKIYCNVTNFHKVNQKHVPSYSHNTHLGFISVVARSYRFRT